METLWTWLTTPPGVADVLHPFGLVFVTVFAIGFLSSAYFAGPGGSDIARHDLPAEAIRHWANIGLWIFGAGLFFFALRLLQINPLSLGEPIWLVGSVIALIVAAIRCVEWWRTVYPARADERPNGPEDFEPISTPARLRPPLPARRAGCPPGGGAGG